MPVDPGSVPYAVVFDVLETGFRNWRFSAPGLVFIVVGVALPFLLRRAERPSPKQSWQIAAFSAAVVLFALIWTGSALTSTYQDYRSLTEAVRAGRASMVEGRVADFRPMPATGHALERFCVDSHCFEYSDYIVTAGFNNTASHGGPIREGLQVRVTYVGNRIARLEVAR